MHRYDLSGYGGMIADHVRSGAYAQALRQTVKPGSVVLEIGAGPGLFAILACQLGASRVFAVEAEEIIQVARENAVINHCADRIEFIEDLSTRITLSAKADVIVSDLHGLLPLFEQLVPSIVDARRRFLAPSGVLIPRKETLWAAVVEVPKHYDKIVEPWERSGLEQNLGPARQRAVNDYQKLYAETDQLLTAPQLWATLDYMTVEGPDVCDELQWTVERAGTGHGIIVWFDSDLAPGVSLSNAPGKPKMIFGSMFLPWIHPVSLGRGERDCIRLEAKLIASGYLWRWTTQVKLPNPSREIRDHFDQSTMRGSVVSLGQLHKTASDHVPRLSTEGLLDRKILEMMDGHATLEEIAKRLAIEFPQRFARWQDALAGASLLSRKYSS